MGLMDLYDKIRDYFKTDKEQAALLRGKGLTLGPTAFDFLTNFSNTLIQSYLELPQDLLGRYADYEAMDDYPEVSSALDIYANDATQPETPTNRRVWVNSNDKELETLLNDFLKRSLRIEEDIWTISRTLCNYGNCFEEIVLSESGVVALNHLPAPTVRRVEGERGELFGFVQDYQALSSYSPMDFQRLVSLRGENAPIGPGLGVSRTG